MADEDVSKMPPAAEDEEKKILIPESEVLPELSPDVSPDKVSEDVEADKVSEDVEADKTLPGQFTLPEQFFRNEEAAQIAVNEMRMQRVLKENIELCVKLAEASQRLDKARLTEEELQVTWRGASNVFSRQKLVAENLQKSTQQQSRVELQRLAESANQLGELRGVHSQLQSVNRQLDFATTLQSAALTQCENKIAARTRRIRKLELSIYRLIAEAQCHPSLERSVANLVSKCGPLVHNVLSREAQRQALDLAAREDAARAAREDAARESNEAAAVA